MYNARLTSNLALVKGLVHNLFASLFIISTCCVSFINTAYSEDKPSSAASEAKDAKSEALTPESQAASINGKKITVADVDKQIERNPNFAYFMQNAKDNPKLLTDLRRRVAHSMVNREILLEEAKKSSLVSESEVDESVNKVIAGYGGKDKLSELLKGIKTDMPTFESEIRKDFTISNYIDKALLKDVAISDKEIKAEFDKAPQKYAQKEGVHARHILIKVEPTGAKEEQDAANLKINQIYTELTKDKKDFAELAKTQSQCPSAAQGGDLGTFNKGMMVPEFETQAFSMKPGEISKPFKTQFGYHIVKVEEHMAEKAGTVESAKPTIEKELLAKKREAIVEAKLNELRKGYAVSVSI
jgi:peptidyl-prolyl cis-trans isomerase C